MRIALTGNPNSGKTTLFNAVTGKLEYVGNWSGVTVEKKEATVKEVYNRGDETLTVVDLPGAYSMSPYTNEESITSNFVQSESPDVIVNIVDSTNLSRSLFFTTQLTELGIPVVVALNKCDLMKKKNTKIDVEKLSAKLGCPVVETIGSQSSKNGLGTLIDAVIEARGSEQVPFMKLPNKATGTDDKTAAKAFDKQRFAAVKSLTSSVEEKTIDVTRVNRQDTADKILTHPVLGLVIFGAVMWAVFYISQETVGPWLAEILGGWIDWVYNAAEGALGEDISPFLTSLLLDGIIGGVGAVLGFLPLIMVLFFLIALLEDVGYMARVAVVMDRYFKPVGLSGKSVIPMIVGTACSIPGVMATRTIKNERQRRATALLTPFIPCGAKMPIIALFAGVFFGSSALVSWAMYLSAIVLIFLSAVVIQRITGSVGKKTLFIMELPEYKIPSFLVAFKSMLERGKAFIIKAGTIILLMNAAVQIMQTFDTRLNIVEEGAESASILATLSTPFALLFIPLGFGVWQFAAAAVTGLIAKENVVGTLAVVFGITNFIDVDELEMIEGAATGVQGVMGISGVVGLAFLAFNLFTPPCFAAIGAMNSEMESKKWLAAGVTYQLAVGYISAFMVYQIGTIFTEGTLGEGFAPGLAAVLAMASVIGYFMHKGVAEQRAELATATA